MRIAKLIVTASLLSFSSASFAQDFIKALQRLRTIAEVGDTTPDQLKEFKHILKTANRMTPGIKSGLKDISGSFTRNFIFEVGGTVIQDLGGKPLSLATLQKNAEYGRLSPQDLEDLGTILECLQREEFAGLILGLRGMSGSPAQSYVIHATSEVVRVLGGNPKAVATRLPGCLTDLLR